MTTPTMTPGAAVCGRADRTAASSFAVSSGGSGAALAGVAPSAITLAMFVTHFVLSAPDAAWAELSGADAGGEHWASSAAALTQLIRRVIFAVMPFSSYSSQT